MLLCIVAGLAAAFLLSGGESESPASYTSPDEVAVPIIMYHSVLKDASRSNSFTVTPEILRSDLQYLRNNGYTTVFIRDLVNYVYSGIELPDKPIILTFDDGCYNNLTYALPLLEEFGMKAVISVVGSYSLAFSENPDPNPNYAYLSWEDIIEITDSGRVEIQNHTFDLHRKDKGRLGAKRKPGEADWQYKLALKTDIMRLQELLNEKTDLFPIAVAYPFGYYDRDTDPILRELGFFATMTCYEKVNIVSDAESLFGLGRYNRPADMTTEAFMSKIE